MEETIKSVFEENIKLIGLIGRAVYFLRTQEYDRAFELISETAEPINIVTEAVLGNREYFGVVSIESIEEMIKGITEAKRKRDYVLLADLMEMQLLNFVCSVEEFILKKEDFLAFDMEVYGDNIRRMKEDSENAIREIYRAAMPEGADADLASANTCALFDEELDPGRLLSEGFFVEYSSCGLMTLAGTDNEGNKFYYHSNNMIEQEAFLFAQRCTREKADLYIVFGFGMGYHIDQLSKCAPGCKILVFEPDMRVLKLAAAFSKIGELLSNKNVRVAYDPDLLLFEKAVSAAQGASFAVAVHEPSLRKHENTRLWDTVQSVRRRTTDTADKGGEI